MTKGKQSWMHIMTLYIMLPLILCTLRFRTARAEPYLRIGVLDFKCGIYQIQDRKAYQLVATNGQIFEKWFRDTCIASNEYYEGICQILFRNPLYCRNRSFLIQWNNHTTTNLSPSFTSFTFIETYNFCVSYASIVMFHKNMSAI